MHFIPAVHRQAKQVGFASKVSLRNYDQQPVVNVQRTGAIIFSNEVPTIVRHEHKIAGRDFRDDILVLS